MRGDDRSPTILAFGDFRLNTRGLELRKDGIRIRMRQQPARVLALLARRSGDIVTREELQSELWGEDTFVDFERGLNNCIKQIRQALNDDPANPTYLETIPRQGYRFLARVESMASTNGEPKLASVPIEAPSLQPVVASAKPEVRPTEVSIGRKLGRIWIATLAGVLAIAALGIWMLVGRPAFSFHERDSILVSDFENRTGDPRFDDALRTAFTVALEQSRYANVLPRTRVESALKRMGKSENERVTTAIGQEICQREGARGLVTASITRTGNEYALTAELIDPATGAPVRSYSERVHGEDHILDALDIIAGKIRADLGESLYGIHQADRPLPQVTTASLTALKQYTDAQSLWRRAKFEDAVGLYRSAVALDADFAIAHAALGTAYCSHVFNYQRELCKREFQKAMSVSSRVTERERRIIEVGYARELGPADDADRLSRLYLADYPDDWQARYNYAQFLRLHGQEQEAIGQFTELTRIAPNDGRNYLDIATAYKSLGKPTDAIRAYSEAFRLNPVWLNVTSINREYGFTLVANGEETKAEQVFSALAANPDARASALDSLAMLDLLHGRYAQANRRLEEALSLAEQRHEVFLTARNHYFLSAAARAMGRKEEQLKELNAALADFKNLGPKVEYGSLVGQEFAHAGAIAKAEEIEKQITPLPEPHTDEQAGYLRLLQGEIALAKGNAAEAAKFFDLQDPQYARYGGNVNAISIEALGRAYGKGANIDEAVSWYEKLFVGGSCRLAGWEPQTRCPEARLALVAEYLARGDKQKASATLAPMLKAWQEADTNLPLRKQALKLQSQLSN